MWHDGWNLLHDAPESILEQVIYDLTHKTTLPWKSYFFLIFETGWEIQIYEHVIQTLVNFLKWETVEITFSR